MDKPARALKIAPLLCTFVSCLLAYAAAAQAVTSYGGDASANMSGCYLGCLPGTGMIVSLGDDSTLTPPPITIGNASVFSTVFDTGTAPKQAPFPPFTVVVSAETSGVASSPPSFASSFRSAMYPTVVFNQNSTTEDFTVLFTGAASSGVVLDPSQLVLSSAEAHASVKVLLDGSAVLIAENGQVERLVPSVPGPFNPNGWILTVPLPTGFHSLVFEAEAFGFASEMSPPTPTPEPVTLLLFGTTAAGLGITASRRRRRT
jgi:hypothetical protein